MKNSFLILCTVQFSFCFLQAQSIDFQPLASSPEGSIILTELFGDQVGNLYAISPNNFDVNGAEFYSSQNAGVSWQKMNKTLNDLRIAPDGTIYGLQGANLFLSNDLGTTWALAHNGAWLISTSRIQITAVGSLLATENLGISRSIDQGATWQNVSLPTGEPNYLFTVSGGSAYAFSFKPVGTDYWSDVYRSTDDGLSWQLVGEIPDIFFDGFLFQTISGRLIMGDDDMQGIYYSDDQGVNWTKFSQPGIAFLHAQSILQQSSGRVWITTKNSWRFYSDDDGNTWTRGGPGGIGDPLKYLWQMPDGSIWGDFYGSLFKADDDTLDNWTFQSQGIQAPPVLDMKALDENQLYVCTTAGMFRTLDGGITWTHFFQQPIYSRWLGRHTSQFCLDDQGNVVLADGKQLLKIEPQTGIVTDITPSDLHLPPVSDGVRTIVRLPDGDLLAGAIESFRSDDNGETWTLFAPTFDTIGQSINVLQSFYVSDTAWILNSNLWYNPTNNHIRWISISNINNLTGTTVDADGNIHTMLNSFVDSSYCVSHDAGTSWECINGKPYWLMGEMFVNLAGQIFVQVDDFGLYISDDGGHSWHLNFQDPNYNLNYVRRLTITPNQYIFIAPIGVGIYRTTGPTFSQALEEGNSFNKLALMVFPNPSANGEVNIVKPDWSPDEEAEILIMNSQGMLLRREKALGESISLELEGLAAGFYFITWKSKRGVLSAKWVNITSE
ncbi:MAG: T9SS type A sorting domain-containing protein [Saprospiraceae bacterium]|nr:T9SS type A sorting domain-containing protein [Saprospiraceae bacterium]MCF8251660.1 T9SS type A sorting domain-containing protein [Saprospiraceae bacterium]MCF8281070.1 T9SS type A sorting domain-containing protein [Bacteroidales bacterium]MCF8313279.1 T9SS type A sorting domain-containing protein [Saprospiraceae bacterium]MCF8442023.1 T9SS type A sorting domain-containing protein [Saprospiraceae bacterium]